MMFFSSCFESSLDTSRPIIGAAAIEVESEEESVSTIDLQIDQRALI